MPTVVISGANRGLGLEFVRQYASEDWDVIAACRNPLAARELRSLTGPISIRQLDVAIDDSIEAFAAALSDVPLDVIIMNAGISAGPLLSIAAINRGAWEPAIVVNALAPLRLAAALRSNLEKGSQRKAVAISSLAGSIRHDVSGQYAYRASKAALNSLWRTLSIEWRPLGILCLLLEPGYVRTRMTGFAGDLDPEQSVEGMRHAISDATMAESGRFIGYDGKEVPW